MFDLSTKAISFNFLNVQSAQYMHPDMYYEHPSEILEYCLSNLSRFSVVNQSYPLYEFTVTVFKEPFVKSQISDPSLSRFLVSKLTKRIAIVPARAGSKRIQKNIRNFCGKPILSYILHAIQDSSLFDVVHVSTDSTEIASIAEAEGFPVDFYRPFELADDITPLYPVVRFVLSTYLERDISFDTAALLMPCSPLISSSDLVKHVPLLKNRLIIFLSLV